MGQSNSKEGAALLKSGDFSDFKITCDNEEFLVHRNIISTKSKFLAACVKGDFKVGIPEDPLSNTDISQEAQTGVLDLPEEEPYVLAMALSYIYMGGCGLETVKEIWPRFKAKYANMQEDDNLFFENMIKLYKLGDRLMMQDLTEHAGHSMFDRCLSGSNCDLEPNGWCDCSVERHNQIAAENLEKRGSQLCDLVTILYEKLPDDTILRARAAVEALDVSRQQQSPSGFDDSHSGEDTAIVEILKENDLVAWNVARHYQKRMELQQRKHRAELRSMKRAHAEDGGWAPNQPMWNGIWGLDLDTSFSTLQVND